MRIRLASLAVIGVAALGACGTEPAATADRTGSQATVAPPRASPPSSMLPLSPVSSSAPLAAPPPVTTVAVSVSGGSVAPDPPPASLDLADLPVESVPMGLTEYLSSIAFWVGQGVDADVWGGSALTGDGTVDVTIELYGTDADLVNAALDDLDPDERDRFTVVEVDHSVRDLQRMASDARVRLIQADLDASAWVRFGLDAVGVTIQTPDGAPDADLESTVTDLLIDLPVVIEFGTPPRLLNN